MIQTACKKDPILQTIHSDTTIVGNQPPNYTGVPTLNIQLYVNKLYVDLLGREPNATELQTNTNLLITENLNSTSREQIVDGLLNDQLYYDRLFEITSSDFINGYSVYQIQQQDTSFTYQLALAAQDSNQALIYYFNTELDRLAVLLQAEPQLMNGTIDINEFYRRFLDNYFYDQVNMGSENFVKGSFDDLFRRAPTVSELNSGITMIEGLPGVTASLFLTDGANKGDYMNIVTHADAFYEGLARKAYLQLLLREPTSEELGAAIAIAQAVNGYKTLQKQIAISHDYAGF